MCGNEGRCVVAFAYHLGIVKNKARFFAIDGEYTAEIIDLSNNQTHIKLKLNDVYDAQIKHDY